MRMFVFSPGCEKFYNFSVLASQLNEPEDGVAPTDSRLRPDQRLMEEGRWDEANSEKIRLEEKQRAKRREQEAAAEVAFKRGMYHFKLGAWLSERLRRWSNKPSPLIFFSLFHVIRIWSLSGSEPTIIWRSHYNISQMVL